VSPVCDVMPERYRPAQRPGPDRVGYLFVLRRGAEWLGWHQPCWVRRRPTSARL